MPMPSNQSVILLVNTVVYRLGLELGEWYTVVRDFAVVGKAMLS